MFITLQDRWNEDAYPNFSPKEFRCPCCGRLTIDSRILDNLQHLRTELGRPITVTSGYRCWRHNRTVGGGSNSLHLQGLAVDLHIEGYTPDALAHLLLPGTPHPWCGLGTYPSRGHVHVDFGPPDRRWTDNTPPPVRA